MVTSSAVSAVTSPPWLLPHQINFLRIDIFQPTCDTDGVLQFCTSVRTDISVVNPSLIGADDDEPPANSKLKTAIPALANVFCTSSSCSTLAPSPWLKMTRAPSFRLAQRHAHRDSCHYFRSHILLRYTCRLSSLRHAVLVWFVASARSHSSCSYCLYQRSFHTLQAITPRRFP